MNRPTDIRIREAALHLLPVQTRVPLKFGAQVVDRVTCARVRVVVEDRAGRCATGWGETPLSVAWVWPSGTLTWNEREARMIQFTQSLIREFAVFPEWGHPLEIGHAFGRHHLAEQLALANAGHADAMPHLAALVCQSAGDLAVYDAFGQLHQRRVFDCFGADLLGPDLTSFLEDAEFAGQRPNQFLQPAENPIPVWHLVGGLDAVNPSDLTGQEPSDGHPVLLRDWIRQDGLQCLKIKLRGNDAEWDYRRVVEVGQLAIEEGCTWLTTDFNCTVTDPAYVCEILDRLLRDHPRIYGMLLYVEQPFPYDLEANQIDVHSVSARKPLFLDESAHDWRYVRLGRSLGWTGVALKTCKTLTGAILSLCWAKSRGMTLMVQDLTNPMLAQIPHVSLAAHAGTIMGVESNAMQFYPEASAPERAVHPNLYARRGGHLDLSTLGPAGFGYRLEEIARELPEPVALAEG